MDDGTVRRLIALVQVVSILAWNSVPVLGVFLWDWPAVTVLLLYWVEVGVITLLSGVRVAMASGRSTPGSRITEENLEDVASTMLAGSSFYFIFTLLMGAWLSGPAVDLSEVVSVSWFPWAVGGILVGHAISTGRYVRSGYATADADDEWLYAAAHYLVFFPVVLSLITGGVDGAGWMLGAGVVVAAVAETLLEVWGDVDWSPRSGARPASSHTHVDEADLPEEDPAFVRRPDWARLVARTDERAFSSIWILLVIFLWILGLVWGGSVGLIHPPHGPADAPMNASYPHVVFVAVAFWHACAASGIHVGLRYLAHRNEEYRFYDDRVVAVDRKYQELLWSFRYDDLDGVQVAPKYASQAMDLDASGIRLIEDWDGAMSTTLSEFEDSPRGNIGTATPPMTELYGVADRQLVRQLRTEVHDGDE